LKDWDCTEFAKYFLGGAYRKKDRLILQAGEKKKKKGLNQGQRREKKTKKTRRLEYRVEAHGKPRAEER